jgi:hypothetical protein
LGTSNLFENDLLAIVHQRVTAIPVFVAVAIRARQSPLHYLMIFLPIPQALPFNHLQDCPTFMTIGMVGFLVWCFEKE